MHNLPCSWFSLRFSAWVPMAACFGQTRTRCAPHQPCTGSCIPHSPGHLTSPHSQDLSPIKQLPRVRHRTKHWCGAPALPVRAAPSHDPACGPTSSPCTVSPPVPAPSSPPAAGQELRTHGAPRGWRLPGAEDGAPQGWRCRGRGSSAAGLPAGLRPGEERGAAASRGSAGVPGAAGLLESPAARWRPPGSRGLRAGGDGAAAPTRAAVLASCPQRVASGTAPGILGSAPAFNSVCFLKIPLIYLFIYFFRSVLKHLVLARCCWNPRCCCRLDFVYSLW